MSERVVYHVSPFGDGWKVEAEREDYEIVRDNKDAAIAAARDRAKTARLGQVVVHGEDGIIQEEFTYGEDPRDIPG